MLEKFLEASKKVPLESLYLDPNNPRLALDEQPGYSDPEALFDENLQDVLEKAVIATHAIDDLEHAIESQGWMPIDNMVVWQHPDVQDKYVVVEGNRRLTSLRCLRRRLDRETERFQKMKDGRKRFAAHDILNQEKLVKTLRQIVDDTNILTVMPLAAKTTDELARKLPRVLAVRHITGARTWGNYAEDLWLLARYTLVFEDTHAGEELRWESQLIKKVAEEAAISVVKAKRQILASSCFSNFKARFEDELPDGEEFKSGDYYLFESIVKRPYLREQFGLQDGAINIPEEKAESLFKWTFRLPRAQKGDDNENIFYRHENVNLWDQIKTYDDKHNTSFAQRFNVDEPDTAPRMAEVEAAWHTHKASRQPSDIIEQLLQQLKRLDTDSLLTEGTFLRKQLKTLNDYSGKVLAMIEATHKSGRHEK